MMEMAARAHQLLGCKGASRSDFRWDDELDVLAAEEFVEFGLQIGVATHLELAGGAEDVTQVLGRVLRVGRVDDQDDVGLARV